MTKMQMREATFTALLPGKRKGANKNAARITSIVTLRSARPGGSSDTSQLSHDPLLRCWFGLEAGASALVSANPPAVSCIGSLIGPAIAASMMLGYREQAAGLPQQDQRHQQDIRSQRHFRRQEADIVGGQSDENGADETSADRAKPADDQDDEHENGHAVADLARDNGLVLSPHHPAHAGERGAGHEHADEHAADVIAQRLDHLAILDAGANHQSEAGAGEKEMHGQRDREPDA